MTDILGNSRNVRIWPDSLTSASSTVFVVAAAVMVGAVLRFWNISAFEMSPDEGSSWAAASAHSLREVLAVAHSREGDPGKLGLYAILLHFWVGLFGDRLTILRSLSAICGILSVPLIFSMSKELLAIEGKDDEADADASFSSNETAAYVALFFAVNLIFIKYSREARMYGLMLAITIGQMASFLRSLRRGAGTDFILLGGLTAILFAVNPLGLLTAAVEGFWILRCWRHARSAMRPSSQRHALYAGLAIAAGLAVLGPGFLSSVGASVEFVSGEGMNWRGALPPWAPLSLFNKALGTFAFPVAMGIAVYGVWRGLPRFPEAVSFALLWMWGPPVMLLIVSYAWKPLLVERYVLASFLPFLFLISMGIVGIEATRWRIATAALIVAVSLMHVFQYWRKPHDAQWREAAASTVENISRGEKILVAPPYAVEVVRYYLPADLRQGARRYEPGAVDGRVVLLSDSFVPVDRDQIRRDFPRTLARFRGVTVLGQ